MEKGKRSTAKSTIRAKAPAGEAAAKPKKPAKKIIEPSGFKKQYSKTKPLCKVTFMLPGIAAPAAENVCIVGDFNNWSITEHPMKRLKSGDFSIALDLEPGREYRFRYIIDGCRWENDWNADKYVPTQFGDSENSVVIV